MRTSEKKHQSRHGGTPKENTGKEEALDYSQHPQPYGANEKSKQEPVKYNDLNEVIDKQCREAKEM